jgi:energy-coupling factor transporter ATP-binding protein EcfA2
LNDEFDNIVLSLEELSQKIEMIPEGIDADTSGSDDSDKSLMQDELSSVFGIIKTLKKKLQDKDMSAGYLALLKSFQSSVESSSRASGMDQCLQSIGFLLSDAEKMSFMSSIATLKDTAVIVGANGSGKSTFVNSMADMSLENLTVIPAQKNLYFSAPAFRRESYSIEKYRKINQKETNEDYKQDDQVESQATERLFAPFTYMITALVNEVAQISTDERNIDLDKRTLSTWDRMMKIWKKMIPEITFRIDSVERKIIAIRNRQEYSLNRLSDGEKCILFYIGNVLIARNDAYIVVDEPETFLNAAVYNKLWDILIETRNDCQFIFASHNVEFITARRNSVIVWCKQFIPPDHVELRPLTVDKGIPTALLAELIGSRRKILFCEGTVESLDYQIFSSLYLEDFTVKPVGGHCKVIEYTRVFNELPDWVNNSAQGIIDRDGLTDEECDSLHESHITCLPCNEIEMLLIEQAVMESVVGLIETEDAIYSKIQIFKNKMFNLCSNESDRIVYNVAKNNIDACLQSRFIDSTEVKTTNDIVEQVKEIPSIINPQKIISDFQEQLKKVLNTKDFEGLRRLCTLKGEILNGLANQCLSRDYTKFALGQISKNKILQKHLRQKIGIPTNRL